MLRTEKLVAAIRPTPVGDALIVMTARGICALRLADQRAVLQDQLRDDFGHAVTGQPTGGYASWIDRAMAAIEEPHRPCTAPLDLRGTAFQMRVWAYLQRIPAGQTRTYGDVARGIEQPTATRAVAQACGANHVAFLVPCHRIIRSDGALGGYASGVERKHLLLAREGVVF